jgi:hypothetical protein
MTPAAFRKLALMLEGASESAHGGHPDFRSRGKVFATMGYPDKVVRGAWSGIATIAARYTNGEWPFDGSMQEWVDGA